MDIYSRSDTTYQVSERIAFLCGNTKEERLGIYKQVKHLYNTRSLIVHGQAHKMKGRVTWDSLLVSPKLSVVPVEELRNLIRITTLTIRATLRDKNLIEIYESSRDEKKVNKRITEYFMTMIF